MSEQLENSVREMLKAETWTRAGISNFTTTNLTELSKVIEQARAENSESEIKAICDEQLQHTKESIVALYLSGMVSLHEHSLQNNELAFLVDIFEKNHKENLVEQLCLSIQEQDPENLFALRKLADIYKASNEDKIWELYEKIIQIDFEEADITKTLAERYESQGNQEVAIVYYRKALLRYISTADRNAAKNMSAIKTVWSKLVSLIPDEIDFFLLVQKKIAKSISEDRSAPLMAELYEYYKNTAKWDIAIDILKLLLNIDRKEKKYREEIVECFKNKYADHSHLDDCIRRSNLTQTFRDVFESINDFEKHIAFDAKNYVFHRAWGVGIIRKVQGDDLTIQFGKKYGIHHMKLEMAVTALQPLDKNHIWVLKATKHKEELSKQVKSDIEGTLKIIIRSFDNKCDIKKIKSELVPSILTPGEWTSWHAKAQTVLSTDSTFGVTPNDINMYMVRDHEITQEERLNTEFKAEKEFFPKIDIMMRFASDETTDKSDEFFSDMFNYFASFLKSDNKVNEQTLAAYLVVQNIAKRFPSFHNPAVFTFDSLYHKFDACDVYTKLKDTKNTNLRSDFLSNIRMLSDWDNEFINLFPVVLKADILAALISAGKTDKVQSLMKKSFEDYRNNREAVIYFFKECKNQEWYKDSDISYEKQLVTLVKIIDYCYREIDNHVNTTENKKIIKNACTLLFAEKVDSGSRNNMLAYMLSSDDQSAILRLFTMVNDVKNLDYIYKQGLRKGILDKYPEFKFPTIEVKQEVQNGIYATAKMLEEKKREADNIEKVILPKIAEEISEAREKGDLKENAEYISAKEAQHRQNEILKDLRAKLAKAIVFDPTTVSTSIVSFGTTVSLHDNKENTDVKYTILGPFEADPENGIINYQSPLGNKFLDAKLGTHLQFTINTKEYDYEVTKIEIARIN